MTVICVVRGEEREKRGRPRQAVGEHVYHGVRERESERQTAKRHAEIEGSSVGGLVAPDFFLSFFLSFSVTCDSRDSSAIGLSCKAASNCGCAAYGLQRCWIRTSGIH